MTINFKITNTTSSEVVLKIDGTVISSQFIPMNTQSEFSLDSVQVENANSITIENSDVIYDITESCKRRVDQYIKPVLKVDPDTGIHIESKTPKTKVSDLFPSAERKKRIKPSVNGFADDKVDFMASIDDDPHW